MLDFSNLYGFKSIIRKYSRFPRFLNFPAVIQHGWLPYHMKTDINSKYQLMCLYSKRNQFEWNSLSNKKSIICGAPFVIYKEQYNIVKLEDAIGTIAYPLHSSELVESVYDINNYIQDLKKLPEKYHPITICVHYNDILTGQDSIYRENGFNTVSAGDKFSDDFVKNFYNILAKFKYATSNGIGTHLFYAVDFGTPFFIYGENPFFRNHGNDPNVPQEFSSEDDQISKYVYNLFNTGPIDIISAEQKDFVENEIGINDKISKNKLLFELILAWTKFKIILILEFKYKIRDFYKLIRWEKFPRWRFLLEKKLIERIKHKLYLIRYGLNRDVKIFTHMTLNEKLLLHKTIKGKNNFICAEIGSYLGASSCFIANALGKGSKLYCIDTWQNHAMSYEGSERTAEGIRNTYNDFVENTKSYKKKIIMLQGWSTEMINHFIDNNIKLDFLFIDGDHSYEGCKKDWDLYYKILNKGALVAFHDTGWADGVKKVVKEDVQPIAKLIGEEPNIQIYQLR